MNVEISVKIDNEIFNIKSEVHNNQDITNILWDTRILIKDKLEMNFND